MESSSLMVWRDLGIVETIYEEDGEDYSSSTAPSLSPVISSSHSQPSPLHSGVDAWSLASGRPTDVVIHVEDSIFKLHKAPLEIKSGYLKRMLKCFKEFTLSPPLKITAETFSIVTEFCYGTHILITPFNVAPLRIAADLLDMTDSTAAAHTDNLLHKTETYFRRVVSVNREHASIVLLSSLSLLPEAETTACLVTRCIETLSSMDNDSVFTSLDEVVKLQLEDFLVVVESMNQRFTSHDLLYRIVDLYLKKNAVGLIEEQKFRICNYIDCTTLSSQLLMHAVQNPRMPLRFVVQAMYVEQLNTRRSIISAANHRNHTDQEYQNHLSHESDDSVTLGAILERDAALRQVAQLKAAMDTTNSRIQSLEKELKGMRKLLHESESSRNALGSLRSQSFRFSNQNKIERGQVGSVSSSSLRFTASKDKIGYSSSSEESLERSSQPEKKLGRRLIDGLKNAFRVSTLVSKKKTDSSDRRRQDAAEDKGESQSYEVGKGNVIIIKKNLPIHSQPGIHL